MTDQEVLTHLRTVKEKIRVDDKFTRGEQDAVREAVGVFEDAAKFEASLEGLVSAIVSKAGVASMAPPMFNRFACPTEGCGEAIKIQAELFEDERKLQIKSPQVKP